MAVITSRHDAISCFLSADNLAAVDAMQTHLKGIKNIPRRLSTLRAGRGGVQEWTSLVKVRSTYVLHMRGIPMLTVIAVRIP